MEEAYEMTDEVRDAMWAFIIQHEARFKSMCRRFAGTSVDEDDLWDEVLHKMPRLWMRHRDVPTKIFAHMRWYMWKLIKRRWDRDPLGWRWEQGNVPECGVDNEQNIDDKLEVRLLLESLPYDDAVLLVQRIGADYTFDELADAMGTTRFVASDMVREALERARRRAHGIPSA